MNTKGNKKSIYTKKILASTLVKMLDNLAYNDITILQICQYGNIARASFYRNFQSKDEVMLYYIQSIIDSKLPNLDNEARMFLKASESIEVWFNEKDLFKKLYKNDLFWMFTKQMNITINYAFKLRYNSENDPYYDYLATEMAYITSSIFYKWSERGFKENKKEMSELLDKLHLSRAKRELLPPKEKADL